MKLKIKSNISFLKLLKFVHSNQFSNEVVDRIVDPIIKDSKKAIIDGKIKPPLRPATLAARKSRPHPKSIGGDKPLYDTGSLYDSIKPSDNNDGYNFGTGQGFGIEFLKYGLKHITGDGVPQRNFIKLDPKSSKKLSNQILQDLRKALRK